jgi:hypothetical protein
MKKLIAIALAALLSSAALAQSPTVQPSLSPSLGGSAPVSAQVACLSSATLLLSAATQYYVRVISNQSGQTVYIGPAGVTQSNGMPIPTGSGYDASHEQGALYCIAASSATVGTIQY